MIKSEIVSYRKIKFIFPVHPIKYLRISRNVLC